MSKTAQLADEILAKLTAAWPDLLTRQQLAETCPSAGGDPQKCSLALLELKTSGLADNVPKVGWRLASDAEGESYEDEAPARLRKMAQAIPVRTSTRPDNAAPGVQNDGRGLPPAADAQPKTAPEFNVDEEIRQIQQRISADTDRRHTDAVLAVTHAAQAARNALRAYIAALDDPLLQQLRQMADIAESARERLTQEGNAEEA